MLPTSRRQLRAELLLLLVTLFWGLTVPLMKGAFAEIPVLSFLWQRFALALLILLPFCLLPLLRLSRAGWINGLLLGVLLFLSFLFQTIGLEQTSASNTGFITGLCVVWVPLLAMFLLKRAPGTGSKIGTLVALAGLILLTWRDPWRFNAGDGWVLLSSIFIALHIIGLDTLARGHDARALTLLQVGLLTLFSFIGSWWHDPQVMPQDYSDQLLQALVITAFISTALAFWVQTSYQRATTPTRATLIYILEPVFAALFSLWLLNEQLSPMAWFGGALIVVGMLVAEAYPGRPVIGFKASELARLNRGEKLLAGEVVPQGES